MDECRPSMDSFSYRIFCAARDGEANTLYLLLTENPNADPSVYLNNLVSENSQKYTSLVAAIMNGHSETVKIILGYFKINIEQETVVHFDDELVPGATALWCAAGCGSYDIVKLLIAYGADVNHFTKGRSTPLRTACFDGRLDIVQYLIEYGANIHISNYCNNTCLMAAAFRGHMSVVSYLIKNEADINAQDNFGKTALHYAAQNGYLDIVIELLKNEAKIIKDNIGMTPLMIAADVLNSHMVEILITSSLFSKAECVEALELLGASYIIDKYNLEQGYCYLEKATRMRKSDEFVCSSKPLLPPMAVYNYRIECQTLENLKAIKDDTYALHMESLLIRKRILGQQNPKFQRSVLYHGAEFADVGMFEKCIDMWLYVLHLHKNNIDAFKNLLKFAALFSHMLKIGKEISFICLVQVLDVTLQLLRKNMADISSADKSSEIVIEEFENNVHTVLYLLVISSKLVKKFTLSEETAIYEIVYAIIKLNVTTQNGSSLLHLSVNANTPVDNFHISETCKFPCASTAQMLIQCGANVNVVDKAGNMPLHIAVSYQNSIADLMTLHSIINQLIESGAHIDAANNEGITSSDSVLTGVPEIISKAQSQISLQCLAARAILKYDIYYDNIIHEYLKVFIDIHGKRRRRKE